MDGTSDISTLGPVGYVVTGSGGGGAGGQYVFASVEHLDRVIATWVAFRDAILADGHKLFQARQLIAPPAHDIMSRLEAKVTVDSLNKAWNHNRAMHSYADGYVTKLQAARTAYAAMDDDAAKNLRQAGGR
ncbi:MAG: hypothetical protein ACJ72N_06740 [Labedaea sp.]